MANPQPDQYTKLSNELYEAIIKTDFSKRQRNILDLVIRLSYGCGKKYALLRPSDFQLCGVGKNKIKEELEYLVQAKVLFVDGERIELNKDYDQWRISLIKNLNEKKWTEVLKRNLSHFPSRKEVPKTGTMVPKTGTDEKEEFPKRELHGSQNGNYIVPETGTHITHEPSNDAGFQPRKEIERNINKEDRRIEEETCDPIREMEELFVVLRGAGLHLSPLDYESMKNLLESEIPLSDIIEGIEYAFNTYKPRYPGDRIRSFSYCESVVRDLHARKQARLRAQQEAGQQMKVIKMPQKEEPIIRPNASAYKKFVFND